jgi:hypothetical protein
MAMTLAGFVAATAASGPEHRSKLPHWHHLCSEFTTLWELIVPQSGLENPGRSQLRLPHTGAEGVTEA